MYFFIFYLHKRTQLLWQPLVTKTNSSTSNKSQRQISNGEYKLCNSQENSTGNHNSILLTIYIKYPWSVLRLCILLSCPCSVLISITNLPHVLLLIHLMSISRLVCRIHMPWCHTLNPTLNLRHPCMHQHYEEPYLLTSLYL